ncbi:MAG: ABC transporter substrate-binding protein [Nitrospinota bacterium]|jgi:branched-chain amino acid transport system substrate-binding protein|nr:ABC transporter substrate-binding protein [Nitrospinota bacterium]
MRKMTAILFGFWLLFTWTGFAVPAVAQELRVGLPVPLTGFVAESAQEMVEGFKLYLEQTGGKLGGMSVKLTVEDTEAKPQNAITKMRKLVENDKVHFVVGYLLAFEGYAVRKYAIENKVLLFLPIVAADDLTQRKRSPYIVRMIWTSSQTNHPFGEYAYKKLGYRRIATVGQDYAFGWESVGGFQRTFEAAGGKVVQKIWVPLNAADHGPYVSQIRRDVDAVFGLLVGSHIPKFFKAYQDFGLKAKIPIIGANIMTDEDVLKHMGDEALGVLTSHSYAATLKRPENVKFVKAFQARYKKDPSYYAEGMYTAALWLDRALKKTGLPTNKLKFIDAVKSVDLRDAPRSPLRLDKYNNPIETIYIRKVVRKKSGKGLDNEVIDSIPNVSQFWTIDPDEYMKRPPYSRDFPPCKHCK